MLKSTGGWILTHDQTQRSKFQPKPVPNVKSSSEPAPSYTLPKDPLVNFQSISENTATLTNSHLKFLSRFGRANGERNRGLRRVVFHINDCLFMPESLTNIGPIFLTTLVAAEEKEFISLICLESVDFVIQTPMSNSEFVDETSSTDIKQKLEAFVRGRGVFEVFFAYLVEPGSHSGSVHIRSLDQVE